MVDTKALHHIQSWVIYINFWSSPINFFNIRLTLFSRHFWLARKKNCEIQCFHARYIFIPQPSRCYILTVSLPVKHMKDVIVNFTFQSQKLKIWRYVWCWRHMRTGITKLVGRLHFGKWSASRPLRLYSRRSLPYPMNRTPVWSQS
jgi:hypothetical protein